MPPRGSGKEASKEDKKKQNEKEKTDNSKEDKKKQNDKSNKDSSQEGGSETSRSQSQEGKKKQKEFFKEELKRLQKSLEEEASKVKKPDQQEHTPDTFNDLGPYFDTYTADKLINMPEQEKHGFVNRKTAIGLCDPWVDHQMDVALDSKVESKPVAPKEENKKQKKKNEKRPPKEGSTRLPKFPAVGIPSDNSKKTLYYSDVPTLRDELQKKYSTNATRKVDQDYTRTKQDFYRMELDRMEEYHPINRPNMRAAYFAYLQNNPGSRKAIYECIKSTEQSKS